MRRLASTYTVLPVGNMNHPPNAEAVSVFLTTVLPKLFELKWKGKQGFKFHVVASNIIPDSLKKLLTEHKTVVQLHSNLTPEQVGGEMICLVTVAQWCWN